MKNRFIGIVVVIVGVSLFGQFYAPSARSGLEEVVEGQLEVLIEEGSPRTHDFKPETIRYHYNLKLENGGRLGLKFKKGNEPKIRSGSKVRIRGQKVSEGNLTVSDSSTSFVVLSEAQPLVAKKTAVILFNFANNPIQPYSVDHARAVTFTDPSSSNAYYQEVSFGQLGLTGVSRPDGDVYGWYTIPNNNNPCDYNTWIVAAEAAAQADGFVSMNYNNITYGFPLTSACSWWGLGTIGGGTPFFPSRAWINGTYSLQVVGHEHGHNWGAYHSHGKNCTDSAGTRVAISSTCTNVEYGDIFDIMGGSSTGHMNIFQKGHLNWLNVVNTQEVTQDGDYTLVPIEQSSLGVQSLRIPRVRDINGNVIEYYYLDYRQPYGFDNYSLTNPVVNGVSIRTAGNYLMYFNGPSLLDTTPTTTTFADSALAVNKTFADTVNGVLVKTLSLSPGGAIVNVHLGPIICTPANPSISISPVSQSAYTGQTLNYSITITNNDDSFCSPATFNIIPTLPAGWIQTPASFTFTLAPNETRTQVVGIASTANTPSGLYTIIETVTNNSNPSFIGSAQANYTVNQLDTTPPSVTITQPANGATIKGTVNIVVSALDASGVAEIKILLDNQLLKTCFNTTSCSKSFSASSVTRGTHTITAQVKDKAVPVANSKSASITVRK